MLDHAVGPNVVRQLNEGLSQFLDRHADRGWRTPEDFRGLRRESHRDAIADSPARSREYQGGYEPQEGYAPPTGGDGEALPHWSQENCRGWSRRSGLPAQRCLRG